MQASASERITNIKNNVYNHEDVPEFTVSRGNFFDYFKLQEEPYQEYAVQSITADEDSQVYVLSHSLYLKYANNHERKKENVLQILIDKIKGLEKYTASRARTIRD